MRRMRILGVLALASLLAGCVGGEPPTAPIVDETPESLEVPQESPEPEPAPVVSEAFTTPWPSGFTRRELADSALAKTYEFLERREQGSGDQYLTMVFQDTVLEFHREWISDLATLAADAFSDSLDEDLLLVLGTEGAFLVETLDARGRELVPGFEMCCFSGDTGVAYLGTAWISSPSYFTTEGLPIAPFVAPTPHDFFHLIQDSLDKGPASQVYPPGNPLYRPLWFTEGTAEFMGYALVSYRGYHPYWGNHFIARASDAARDDLLLSRHEEMKTPKSDDPYHYGQLATEYIVASVGVEPLMRVWELLGQGASFDDAFEEALGISVQDFYAAYDDMIENMVVG